MPPRPGETSLTIGRPSSPVELESPSPISLPPTSRDLANIAPIMPADPDKRPCALDGKDFNLGISTMQYLSGSSLRIHPVLDTVSMMRWPRAIQSARNSRSLGSLVD